MRKTSLLPFGESKKDLFTVGFIFIVINSDYLSTQSVTVGCIFIVINDAWIVTVGYSYHIPDT